MLKLYQILTTLFAPIINLYIFRRKLRGKEDLERFSERHGYASLPRPDGKLIWVHAASVGESISVLPLVERLSIKYSRHNFLITTGTITSAKLLATRMPQRTFHQYIPIDRTPYVKRFLEHWQPDFALWVESELWPNIISQAAERCRIIMVNGSMSEESLRKWQKCRSFISQILGKFTICFAQSSEDGARLQKLGANNIKYSGNIKYDAPPLPANSEILAELSGAIGLRPVWLAVSTHKGEELIAAYVHKNLQAQFPDILTIIVPRHTTRKNEILSEMKDNGLEIAVRSNGGLITEKTDIYLADTMGELGIFFRLAKIVFIGNSLNGGDGHNPLEPARIGCAIIIGPAAFNFAEINREFSEKNAIITVQDKDGLKSVVAELLVNNEKTEKLITSSLALVQEKNHIIDKIIEEIAGYM